MPRFFKSTYSQLSVMFGLLLLINLVVLITSLRQFTIVPTANQLAMQLNNQIISLKPLLINKEFEQARNTLNKIFKDNKITVTLNPIAYKLPALKFYQVLERKLASTSPKEILIRETKSDATIFIKPSWINDYWIKLTFQPFIYNITHFVLVLIIALMIMSTFAAFLFSRYMLRPLKLLANMTNEIAENKDFKGNNIGGTTEVQEIGQMVKNSAIQIQQLNYEKELLLAGVSHDLRTPLARMRLQAEFLKDVETRNDFILEIEEMDNIIGDFVTYVRLGATEKFQNIDLVQLIFESIKFYNDNNARIQWQSECQSLYMLLKPNSVKRMLNNIIDNALKYGNQPVVISLDQSNNSTKLCIRDHGNGLRKDEISQVFEPFYMAHKTDNKYGSGLGLSIVKKLAQQNNAQVTASNHVNGGLVICLEWQYINQ